MLAQLFKSKKDSTAKMTILKTQVGTYFPCWDFFFFFDEGTVNFFLFFEAWASLAKQRCQILVDLQTSSF